MGPKDVRIGGVINLSWHRYVWYHTLHEPALSVASKYQILASSKDLMSSNELCVVLMLIRGWVMLLCETACSIKLDKATGQSTVKVELSNAMMRMTKRIPLPFKTEH